MPTARTRHVVVAVLVTVLVAAAAVPATVFLRERGDRQRLRAAAAAFADAWRAGRLETVAYSGATGADVAARVAAVTAALTPAAKDLPAAVDLLGVDHAGKSARATERLRVRWDLGLGRTWQYETEAALVRVGQAWQVQWAPSLVHPKLVPGQVLITARAAAPRGEIVGSGGEVLVTARPVVMVGIEPRRASDRRATAAAVAAVVDVDGAALAKRVLAAAPSAFVDVITLRQADFDAVESRLRPIPGAVFRATTLSLAPTPQFARSVLGTVGPATAELVKASGGRVQPGDLTGLSGIQRRYDARLSGSPGFTVTAAPAPAGQATGQAAGQAAPPRVVLHEVAAVPGRPVQVGLDLRVQQVAERVLATAAKPSGLVAIRPSTGEVLAVANGPANATGFNRALIGRYPPGSTFKIATTFALLQNGLAPETPVPCPPTLAVGGRVFRNAEGEALGTVPFRTDFAQSCNTAFVGLSRTITPRQLFDAATTLGYGRPNLTGVEAFTGSVPKGGDAVAHAADAIGQGQVLASPLSVAGVTASVASGRYLPPRIVVDPPADGAAASGTASPTGPPTDPPTDPSTDSSTDPSTDPATSPGSAAGSVSPEAVGSASPSPSGTPLPADAITQLQTLTGLVVTSGTGTALKAVAGEPVHGKTGTAEFGSAVPPRTHAWFTGYQGDLAFAIVVEDGGFGGKVAAPLAAAFLTALA